MNAHMPPAPPPPPPPPFNPHGSMGPPMQQMQEQLNHLHLNQNQAFPPQRGANLPGQMRPEIVTIDPFLALNRNGKVPTVYEGYRFVKAEASGEPSSWARVVKTSMIATPESLAARAKEQTSGRSSVMKKLGSKDMSGNKRTQVEKLVAERNAREPDNRFEWKLASIDIMGATKVEGRTQVRETVSMEVILKRVTRPVVNNDLAGLRFSGAEVVDLNVPNAMFGHSNGQGTPPMGIPMGNHGRGGGYHHGGPGQPIIEIAPGPNQHRPQNYGRPPPGPPPPPHHGPQHPDPPMPGPPYQGPPHGPPHGGHGGPPPDPRLPPHHGPQHPGPPMPSPPYQGPPHGGHRGVEVVEDHFPPQGFSPPRGKKPKEYPGQGPAHLDHHPDFHMSSSPKRDNRSKPKLDLHYQRPKEKLSKAKFERVNEFLDDSPSDCSSDGIFTEESDNVTVITPVSSVGRGERRYSKSYGRERSPQHRRRDSHHDTRRDRGSHHDIRRDHGHRSPPASPIRHRLPVVDDDYVMIPKRNIVRDAVAGLRRLSSARDMDRPKLGQHAYTYDSWDGSREYPELRRRENLRRISDVPRRMVEYEFVEDDFGERHDRQRFVDGGREPGRRARELEDLHRREQEDGYFGRPERLTMDWENRYGYRRPLGN